MVRLDVDTTTSAGWSVIVVGGDLDMAGAPALRQQVVGLVAAGRRRIVLDLSGVDFIDSVGLGVLVGALKRARTNDGDVRLASVPRRVRRVLEITDLTRVFTCHDTVAEAIEDGES